MKLTRREEALFGALVAVIILIGSYFVYSYYNKTKTEETKATEQASKSLQNITKDPEKNELKSLEKEIEDESLDLSELDEISNGLDQLDLSSI